MSEKKTVSVVTLEKRATIDRAQHLRDTLLEALQQSDRVLLNLSHVEAVDLTAIQILYAAVREARIGGGELDFTGEVPESMRKALQDGGFCKRAPHDGRELAAALLDFDRSAGKERLHG